MKLFLNLVRLSHVVVYGIMLVRTVLDYTLAFCSILTIAVYDCWNCFANEQSASIEIANRPFTCTKYIRTAAGGCSVRQVGWVQLK